jgi:hypothetical protein
VRLVDDQQTCGGREPRQHGVAEPGVVQPLGADQQDVDLAALDGVVDLLPLLDVGAVDRDGDRAARARRRPPGCASAPAAG